MNAVTVHHRFDGAPDAPVVVLSNSLGTTLAMWEPQLAALTRRFRVLRYDQRGHGGSPVPAGPYDIADLGADVLALLDRLRLDRVHFCGLSLGGMVGMWLAVHAPERIDRLVLCCTAARIGPPEDWTARAATVRAKGTEAVADVVLARWFTPGYRERALDAMRGWRAMLSATPDEGYAASCEAIAALDLEAALSRIEAPTLVIAGAEDPVTPPEHAAAIAARVPAARVAVLEDAAHLANVEKPDALSRLLLDHIDTRKEPG